MLSLARFGQVVSRLNAGRRPKAVESGEFAKHRDATRPRQELMRSIVGDPEKVK